MQGYIVIQHEISISKIHVLHIFTPKGVLVGQCGEQWQKKYHYYISMVHYYDLMFQFT